MVRPKMFPDEALEEARKRCTKCKESKPTTAFSRRKSSSDGYYSWCKDCSEIQTRDWAERNSDSIRKRARSKHLKKTYGITEEEYQEMVLAVGGRCESCGELTDLHIDHDHATGAICGLLCGNCIRAAGMLYERASNARKLATYLDRRKSQLTIRLKSA